ncbi:hypothetical protein RND71_008682 [Anisodus tanguticus]|uniref:Uncharacterized protein n=1 Tax=Anisodus tanguticus TaxID=243964 RepID=A0AAE1VK65_9SOLA|nr:hypothetical protein RND71_008682 [Anisodus tanguticus]
MKMSSSKNVRSSKRKLISSRGIGGILREQRAKLYIIRRCVGIASLTRVSRRRRGSIVDSRDANA